MCFMGVLLPEDCLAICDSLEIDMISFSTYFTRIHACVIITLPSSYYHNHLPSGYRTSEAIWPLYMGGCQL